jgi:hypothetical protein
VRVVEEPIEQRGDGGRVAEQLAPVLHRAIRGEQRRGPLVAAHDDFQEVLGGGGREPTHAEVVDDEQRDGGEVREGGLARAGGLRVGKLVDEGVRLAVEDAMALLDDGEADRLGQVALARARRPEEEAVLVLGDEAAGGESQCPVPSRLLDRQSALHLSGECPTL